MRSVLKMYSQCPHDDESFYVIILSPESLDAIVSDFSNMYIHFMPGNFKIFNTELDNIFQQRMFEFDSILHVVQTYILTHCRNHELFFIQFFNCSKICM